MRLVPGSTPDETVVRWTADGKALYVGKYAEVPMRVDRLDVATGRREPWKTLGPSDMTGAIQISQIAMTGDGKAYAYSTRRMHSHLFVIEGAR